MFRTQIAPGGDAGLTAPDPRRTIVLSATRLRRLADLVDTALATDELDVAADHLVNGLRELRTQAAPLRALLTK
jgi:hypothetical protein